MQRVELTCQKDRQLWQTLLHAWRYHLIRHRNVFFKLEVEM